MSPDDFPPDWFQNPISGRRSDQIHKHWSEVIEFSDASGDIKVLWELSRFNWVPVCAFKYSQGEDAAAGILELGIRNWLTTNPPFLGPNWVCGQEASFRVLNLLLAAWQINDRFGQPLDGLLDLLVLHLKRILPTTLYAVAQDNNHGISEGAALFVAGTYLLNFGREFDRKLAKKAARKGRKILHNRVEKLILSDGSFAQHSTNYHRMILDTLSLTELLRTELGERPFSTNFYNRARLAVSWLRKMVDEMSGDVPILGHDDGNYLFNLEDASYRDYRPSTQLAARVFMQESLWSNEVNHPLLGVFGLDVTTSTDSRGGQPTLYSEGGYCILERSRGFAMLRLPKYTFRPAHADANHLDIWHKGINIIRDGGTYSYRGSEEQLAYYPGTVSHSTVEFDGRDSMPRLGRFLFGEWLSPEHIRLDNEKVRITSTYTDYKSARHKRRVQRTDTGWLVEDQISGFSHHASLRWRLAPVEWNLVEKTLVSRIAEFRIQSDIHLELIMKQMMESRYYLEESAIPVLEITSSKAGNIITEIILL